MPPFPAVIAVVVVAVCIVIGVATALVRLEAKDRNELEAGQQRIFDACGKRAPVNRPCPDCGSADIRYGKRFMRMSPRYGHVFAQTVRCNHCGLSASPQGWEKGYTRRIQTHKDEIVKSSVLLIGETPLTSEDLDKALDLYHRAKHLKG